VDMVEDQANLDQANLSGPTSIAVTGAESGPMSLLKEVQAVLDERLAGYGEVETTTAEDERAAELLLSRMGTTVDNRPTFLLRHLHVHAFKQLREVELWFPERGSILIDGPNEAGKSALIEAIYFGLFGAPLAVEKARDPLGDLLPFRGGPAEVELTLSSDMATLEISRQLLSASADQDITQEAQLRVRYAHRPLEEIQGLEAANLRIRQEMQGLDGDSLRYPRFIEQRGLEYAPPLTGDQRDTSLARLIGIEQLTDVEKELLTAADEAKREADQLRRECEVATLRQAANDADLLVASCHEQIQAARVRLLLEERDSRDTARERQEELIAMLSSERFTLGSKLPNSTTLQELQTDLQSAGLQPQAADEAEILVELATIDERIRTLQQQSEAEAALSARLGEQVVEILTPYAPANREYYGSESLDRLVSDWPLLANVDSARLDDYEEIHRIATQEAHHLRQGANSRAHRYGLEDTELEVESCSQRLADGERECHRFELAAEMAEQVRERIVRRILPLTIAYMQQLLPELTAGRYRDVEVIAQDITDLSAGLRIKLWDEEAGRYVAINLFSGGTRDQCSVALRLAFALATLPKELGAMPGFIFLDEPLSSFDAERAQALVRILTQGTIAEAFDQVVMSSHSRTIDRDSFRYYVRLENGRVSESNLPSTSPIEHLRQTQDVDPLKAHSST
jgi:DNA repair exonuclease SbcCD ATPase subunit